MINSPIVNKSSPIAFPRILYKQISLIVKQKVAMARCFSLFEIYCYFLVNCYFFQGCKSCSTKKRSFEGGRGRISRGYGGKLFVFMNTLTFFFLFLAFNNFLKCYGYIRVAYELPWSCSTPIFIKFIFLEI